MWGRKGSHCKRNEWKYRKMKGLENSAFANIIVIHVSGKNHQWMLKLLGEIVIRIGYLQKSKVSSCKFLINHKGRNNLIVEQPDTPPRPRNQITSPIMAPSWHRIPLTGWEKKTQHYFWGCFCRKFITRSNHEETSDKPKSSNLLQNKWSVLFKNVKVKERKRTSE